MPDIKILLLMLAMMPAASWAQEIQTFEFSISRGKLAEGPAVVRVVKGDRVEMVWSSLQSVEVHLHGYDLRVKIGAGGRTTMSFDATATGRFPISLHGAAGGTHAHKPLAYFEVHPKE